MRLPGGKRSRHLLLVCRVPYTDDDGAVSEFLCGGGYQLAAAMGAIGDETIEPGAERLQVLADGGLTCAGGDAVPDTEFRRLIGDETA